MEVARRLLGDIELTGDEGNDWISIRTSCAHTSEMSPNGRGNGGASSGGDAVEGMGEDDWTDIGTVASHNRIIDDRVYAASANWVGMQCQDGFSS